MLPFLKPKIALRHCLNGKTIALDRSPLLIGGFGADFEIERGGRALCEVGLEGEHYFINSFGGLLLNISGLSRSKVLLEPEEDYSIIVAEHALLICLTTKPSEWLRSRSLDQWTLRTPEGEVLEDLISLQDLPIYVARYRQDQPDAIVHQQNSTAGFRLDTFASVLGTKPQKGRVSIPRSAPSVQPRVVAKAIPRPIAKPSTVETAGQFTCFSCRQPFDQEQALHVAVHASLKGDVVLGPNEMRRFKADTVADVRPLDGMGMPTFERACPHCRRKLPVNFFNSRSLVITVVGGPDADRATYLGALIGRAAGNLPHYLGASLFDGDATENRRLLDLQRKLFSKGAASAIRFAKSELEADWRMEVLLRGKWSWVPKPFIFGLSLKDPAAQAVQLVFYSGELDLDTTDPTLKGEPNVLHFLFDPAAHRGFRQKLRLPCEETSKTDPQELAMAKLRERVEKNGSANPAPLAVLVDKFEMWRDHFVNGGTLENPLANWKYHKMQVLEYSDRLRTLLQEVAPAIVEGAEAISNRVLYFPMSSLGSEPKYIGKDPDGRSVFSPDPLKIDPIWVELPLLWSLRVDKTEVKGGE